MTIRDKVRVSVVAQFVHPRGLGAPGRLGDGTSILESQAQRLGGGAAGRATHGSRARGRLRARHRHPRARSARDAGSRVRGRPFAGDGPAGQEAEQAGCPCGPDPAAPRVGRIGGSFDKVLAVNNMGMWRDPDTSLEELRRIMSSRGRIAIVSQPRCPGATAETSRKVGRDIEDRLARAGFADTRSETLDLSPPTVCVLGTAPETTS